jgi:hypothetical protein
VLWSVISHFLAAKTPCFTLGLVEKRKRQCGFMALRQDDPLTLEISNAGFRFGHSLHGNADFETVHFAFQISGFHTYNVLVNRNHALVKAVLAASSHPRLPGRSPRPSRPPSGRPRGVHPGSPAAR